MGTFLRFVAFFVLLAGVLVLVVLPLALSPLLTQQVREMGLRSDSLQVSLAMFDPALVTGRSKRVTVEADGVEIPNGRIGRVNVGLINADYFDRSFEAVNGSLADVSVTVGGESLTATEITIDGPADAATATARLSTTDARQLVSAAARRAGLTLESVDVSGSGVTVRVRGFEATATVAVRGGALLLVPDGIDAIVLVQAAPADPWQLEEAWVSDSGLNVRATIDFERIASEI